MAAETLCDFTVKGLKGWHHRVSGGRKARVVIVHGLGDHSGRHLSTIDQLTAAGYECVRFDLRGHGESEGRRQWIDSFEDYIEDVLAIFDWVEGHLSAKPVFLHGHSLGGAICLRFAAHYQDQLSGLFVNAPAYKLGDGVSAFKILVAKIMNRFLPGLTMKSSVDITALSRDPEVVMGCQTDPLVCGFNTVRQGYEILKVLPLMIDEVKTITIPVLFTHGQQDRLIQWQGSKELFNICSSGDKELLCFEEAYHELHNDFDREAYFQKILGAFVDSYASSSRC
ncbi:MAG: hypothetical protein ETSY2_45565 [Candidatus Entotheonella gemina]|uniref:Serine aminopeptidase S33 domain-containing protein n=1 Tax=Candidatus Entotheonella gemina TaxID=1429439 RepID=W4LFY8_9BACT|nr:MAG: hypothetical protein ETSY2_45565 [Candidatus Entotheonella gemina]